MHLARSVRLSVAAVACTGLLSLAACSEDSEPESKAVESSETQDPSAEDEATPEAVEGQPDWARPATTGGDLVATVEAGDVTVEMYQVGTEQASNDGTYVDSETKEPLLAKGDDIVFVNYVVTNNGAPFDLGYGLIDIEPRYDDWQWMVGMDSSFDLGLFDNQGVNLDAIEPDAIRDPGVYTFGTGETYSYADNFEHQANSPITFEVVVTPVDAKGEPLPDEVVKGTGTGTIA